MALFTSYFTNYFIQPGSETNLSRDPGNPINPPLNAFEIGLPPSDGTVDDGTLAEFTIGLPPASTAIAQPPSVASLGFANEELKIYNGTTVLFNLGVLVAKQQPVRYNNQGFTTKDGTAGTQGVMGDGRYYTDVFTYTTFYQAGVVEDNISEDIATALSTATHVGRSTSKRLPIKPSGYPQTQQLSAGSATITIAVIPTSIFNLAGGLGV